MATTSFRGTIPTNSFRLFTRRFPMTPGAPVFFTGHIDIANDTSRYMPIPYLAITILRDPVSRIVSQYGAVGKPEDRDFLRLPCLIPSSHEANENRGVHIDDKGPLIFFRRQSVIIWKQVLMRNVVDVFLHAKKTVEYISRKEYWLDRQLTTQL